MPLNIFLALIGFIISLLSNILLYMFCFNDFCIKNSIFYIKSNFSYKKFLSYFFLALLSSFIYLFTSLYINNSLYAIIYCFLFSTLILLSCIDLKIGIVPDRLNFFILILSVFSVFLSEYNFFYHLIGFFLISVPFFLIALFSGGIGGGDIKLFAVCGLFIGAAHIFLAMFISCILATIFGIILKILNKTKLENNKASIPLVPYICIGVIISSLFGNDILNWYLSKFYM